MTATKRASRLLQDLGYRGPMGAHFAAVECALAAAECDGMNRAAGILEKLARGKPLGERVTLQTAALQIRAAKWGPDKQ